MKKILLMIIGLVALLFTLATNSPQTAGLPVYLLVFSILYGISVILILSFLSLAYGHMNKNRQYYTAFILGFSPVILLALATLSSLSIIDVLLAIGLPSAVVWYGSRLGVIK